MHCIASVLGVAIGLGVGGITGVPGDGGGGGAGGVTERARSMGMVWDLKKLSSRWQLTAAILHCFTCAAVSPDGRAYGR